MVPDTSQWRVEAAYDYLDHISAAGFAWEWLRRNPRYQQDYEAAISGQAETHDVHVAIRRRWGLRFRREARSFVAESASILVNRKPQRSGAPCSRST